MTRRLYETTEDYHARLARGLTDTGVASPELREAVAQAACEAGHHAWPTTDGYNDRAEKRAWLAIADAVLDVLSAAPKATETPGLREALGKFGWHPDPVIDFEVEIEKLESRFDCAKHGTSKPGEQPETIAAVAEDIRRALSFKAGGTVEGVVAKNRLRELDRAALSATPQPIVKEPVAWCQPMREGHPTPRVFVVRYEDQGVRDYTFDNEAEARDHWQKANGAWNCYLLASLPLDSEAATPQPVAVPDDGAGRDVIGEAEAVLVFCHGITGEAFHDGDEAEDVSLVDVVKATVEGLQADAASALSAERAAHEQTRFDRDVWHKSFETVTARAEAAEAEVACLRKAAEDAVAHIRGHFPGAAAEFEAVYDRADARSSREAR